jgi:hypothetical protein
MIPLGSTVKDKITGLSGIVTGYVTYTSGCNQALVTPPVSKEGTMRDSAWIDEQRLEVVSKKVIKLDNGAAPGFGPEAPKR